MNRLSKVLANIGILFILLGFGFQIIEYQEELDNYKKQIKELDSRVDEALTKIEKTNAENQYLWSIYYKSGIADQIQDWE
jgi:vacuolar-type H+-ATPase subunit I/STV1